MGNVVAVTGASGGIGRAMASAFSEAGYRVVLGCNHHIERAESLCAGIVAKGGEAVFVAADITTEAGVEHLFSVAEKAFGPVDVLVNNAGISTQNLFTDITLPEWNEMMAVNVTGTFLCCRRALSGMVKKKEGCIINVSSMWGQVGASCEVHYSAAKAAVIGMSRALAKEVGPSGIRVNCIAPGAVDAGMMEGFSEKDILEICKQTPLGRLGAAKEIAEAAVYLASSKAGFITGQVLGVNGGFVI